MKRPIKKTILSISAVLSAFLVCALIVLAVFKTAGNPFSRKVRSSATFEASRKELAILSLPVRLEKDKDRYSIQRFTGEQLSLSTASLDQEVSVYNDAKLSEVLEAEGYYIVDENGEVIAALEEKEAFYPASMTKLMTAILAVENTEDLEELVEVGDLSGSYEEGSIIMYLLPGEMISMNDLLHALLMNSYNDAATAIAVALGGSVEGFAEMMNEKASSIGMINTNFLNPHGLQMEGHYSCPYDMTILLRYALDNPILKEIMETTYWVCDIYGPTYYETKELYSGNYFLTGSYEVPGLTYEGGKTGYECVARSCFASSFSTDEHTYYLTVMKALDAQYMTALLMDYYFSPYALYKHVAEEPIMKEWQLEYEEWYHEHYENQ